MIDTGAIRSKVLELAIQGKLSEQLLEDGNAEELYVLIQEEKQKLIKEGKIKKEKLLADITEEEIPFDIPSNWKWVRLGDCVSILGDGLHGTPKYSTNGEYYFINGNNLKDGKIEIKSDTKCVDFEEYEKYKKTLNDSTVLVSINGTIGNVAFYSEEKVILGKSACYFNMLDKAWKKYIYWIIKTDYFIKYATTKATGVTIKNVSLAAMKLFLIPLPPLEEQERITKKIEDIFNTLDWIDSLQNSYISDSEILKTKIIDAGIQGKLTEQLPDDGTAEESYEVIQEKKAKIVESGVLKGRKNKKINGITESDALFNIPTNWKWMRLGNVCEIFGRIGFRGYTKADIVEPHEGAITISPSNIDGDGNMHFDECTYLSWFKYDESPEIQIEDEDIIIVKTGSSYGKAGIVKNLPEKATINPQLAVLKYILCNKDYLNFVLNCSSSKKQYEQFVVGAAIPTFSQEKLANLIIPLPPLVEQKRIVEKIQEILSII